MKIAYLDCASGISGDMTLGALIDAGAELSAVQAAIDSLGLPHCRLIAEEVKKKGFRATQITIEHAEEKSHRHLSDILALIDASTLTATQKQRASELFHCLGEAEAKVHGMPLERVHFHEVGAVDSIADIVGAVVGFELLGIEQIVASPVPTGTGSIEIAHGRCSVPAPATAELLRGIPLAASSVEAELTTPTGAAILAALADGFGPLPAMRIESIGCGAGQRDLAEQANLLRVLIGHSEQTLNDEQVWIVETDLDDLSGELIGHATARLTEAGAIDVSLSSIQMKKNRPGVRLTVLCRAGDLPQIEETLFLETTTLGVRRWLAERRTLGRRPHQVDTPWGRLAGVVAELPGGKLSFSPEYEACRQIAAAQSVPLREVYAAATAAFDATDVPR